VGQFLAKFNSQGHFNRTKDERNGSNGLRKVTAHATVS
jgi:hypothetical protein